MDLGVAAYSGKGQGEVTLLRQLWNLFQPGDVVLTDSLMCNWRNLYELQQRGIYVVTRLNRALRKAHRANNSLGRCLISSVGWTGWGSMAAKLFFVNV